MADEKKTERKNLTVTHVEEIKKVGDKQIPKLSFKARDGDRESMYFTFRTSLFELVKQGQTINADVETEERGEYTNRKIIQVYVDGQPVSQKGQQGYRGKSPEELDQQARVMVLSYAKDLAIADKIPFTAITDQADVFYTWLKKNEPIKAPEAKPDQGFREGLQTYEVISSAEKKTDEVWEKMGKEAAPAGKVQDVAELKGLMAKHKIGTREVYEILSIKSFMELVDLDQAWADIKAAKKIE
jgi:hypothetical protein